MADSVIKLRIDSKEYDANIKRASEALSRYMDTVRAGGGTLASLDEGVMDAVRALSTLGTKSGDVRGGLREMTQSISDLTLQYELLSETERGTDFGRELRKALNDLTERAGLMRDVMGDTTAAISNAASDTRTFDQLAGGAQLVTSGFQTMQGAAKLMGMELGDNVEVLAKLQSAMAVTNGLQQAQNLLQRQSALMQGVMAVQTRALAAAQSLAAENTNRATIAQKALNAVAKANPYVLLASAVGAVAGALALLGGRSRDTTADVDTLKRAVENLNNSLEMNARLAGKLGESSDAIAQMRVEAAKAAIQMAELEKSKWAPYLRFGGDFQEKYNSAVQQEIDARKQLAEAERDVAEASILRQRLARTWDQGQTDREILARISVLKDLRQDVDRTSEAYAEYTRKIEQLERQLTPSHGGQMTPTVGGVTVSVPDIVAAEGSVAALQLEMQRLQKAQLQATSTKEWKLMQSEIDIIAQKIRTIKGEVGTMGTGLNLQTESGLSSWIDSLEAALRVTDVTSESYAKIKAQIADAKTLRSVISELFNVGMGTALLDSADEMGRDFWERVFSPDGVEDADWDGIIAAINNKRREMGLDAIEIDLKTGKTEGAKKDNQEKGDSKNSPDKTIIGEFGKLASGLSSISGGVEQMGIEVPQGMKDVLNGINGIISILTGINTVLTVMKTLQTIKTLPLFSSGGIIGHAANGLVIPGNSLSGDNLRMNVGVNSGELILNKSQQGVIADALSHGGGEGVLGGTPYVDGETILLGVNNTTRRKGLGEIVTTQVLRRYGLI